MSLTRPRPATRFARVCRDQFEFCTRLYRQIEATYRRTLRVTVSKSVAFHNAKVQTKITFEESAEALQITFKPSPNSKTDTLCLLPTGEAAAAAAAAARRA